ncbi:MAG: B12-binding domain-containing radical SAM protein [bacterium]
MTFVNITVEAAMNVISGAYSQTRMDFTSYRTLFSLLTNDTIRRDAQPDRNPFYDYFSDHLVEYLRAEDIRLIGISTVFPGQLQPSYSLGYILRKALPKIHITIGGPAISQFLVRINPSDISSALGPFHSAVIFEGEKALLRLAYQIDKGERITGIIRGDLVSDLCNLPTPDFDGMPLGSYLSPSLVLPYDPARGCYWGKCAFCHYGLSTQRTAPYKERRVEQVVAHLAALAEKYSTRIFYFSVDTIAPLFATEIGVEIKKRQFDIRWATDMRPERLLNPKNCRKMAEGGALCVTFEIESASPRILRRIDKGIQVHEMREAIRNAASANIGVEVMCFTGFPTETYGEALETIHFINDLSHRWNLRHYPWAGSLSIAHALLKMIAIKYNFHLYII